MSKRPDMTTGTICPYIDHADIRCESRLSLDHLKDAFDLCICNYRHCPVFRQLNHEQSSRETSRLLAAGVN